MKFTPRFRLSIVLVSSVVLLLGFGGLVFAATQDAPVAAPQKAPATPPVAPEKAPATPPVAPEKAPATPPVATAPRLNAVRAGMSSSATTLTLEVGGEFTYFSSASGERLIFVHLPGVLSTQPSESHLLESKLVSSYRVVPFWSEGQPNARLEVLLRQPATVTYEQKPGALQVKFVPATARSAAGAPAGSATSLPVRAKTGASGSALPVRGRDRGTAIEKVTFAREEEDVTRVQILANGPVEYRAFQLASPPRLVVDIPQTESRAGSREIAVGIAPLKSIRVAQFSHAPLVSRVVMDLDGVVSYRVQPRGNILEVEVMAPGAKNVPAARPALEQKPPRTALAEASPVASAPGPRTAPLPEKAPEIGVLSSLENLVSRLPALQASPRPEVVAALAAEPQTAAADQEAAPKSEPAEANPAPSPLIPANAPAATAPAPPAAQPALIPAQAPAPQAPPPPAPPAQAPAAPPQAPAEARYTGEPISVNLKDVDLKDFFRLIHEISGLNIVLDPNVSGRLTIVLEDVPWDQALDIVLRNNGLDKQLEGNVLRIARRDTLRKEEEERLALETARQAAAERVTVMRPLNYARANQVVATLAKFRSPKGEIIADERTNTLIITDIPQVIPTMDDILRQLDRRSVQVEIEARVVAASRNFAREVGVQFGFGTSAAGGRSLFTGSEVGDNKSPVKVPRGKPDPRSFPGPFTTESDQLPLFSNFPAPGASSGLSFIHSSPNAAIDFFISLAETKGIGKLLSRPRIITQNNVQGEVQQGVKIPIQTIVNNTISVQFINATLRLSVRPQVTNEGTIFLEVSVENSTIDPGIARINGIPAVNTQMATTQVLVNDGGTVVFGGVLQNTNNLTILQVPILGSIPVIGHLFKRTGVNTQTNELLFFITPKIV